MEKLIYDQEVERKRNLKMIYRKIKNRKILRSDHNEWNWIDPQGYRTWKENIGNNINWSGSDTGQQIVKDILKGKEKVMNTSNGKQYKFLI